MGPFFKFFRRFIDFILQKVYFAQLIRGYVGLIMLAAYFCHSCQSQVEYICVLIKVDWQAACVALRVVSAVLVVSAGEPIPEEMSQTLLTKKKQGNLAVFRIHDILESMSLTNGSGSGSTPNCNGSGTLH
jgi:hypothetical protein